MDDTDVVMTQLAYKKINAFSGVGHGFYFWNFRTDVYEPSWSYMAALDRGWIPKGNLHDPEIANACQKEDNGDFNCITKTGQLDKSVRKGMKFALDMIDDDDLKRNNFEEKVHSYVDDLSGKELLEEADKLFNDYWHEHRTTGITCDFGGVAILVELNRTITGEDSQEQVVYDTNMWVGITMALVAALIGSTIGFVVAMRSSKKINRTVSQSQMFAPFSGNSLVRKSLSLNKFHYDDLDDIPEDEIMK